VVHKGRKFIWAVVASNRYRRVCLKYLKCNSSSRAPGYRKSLKTWHQRLVARAAQCGIHPAAAFHDNWWDYMKIEVHHDERAHRAWATTLDIICAGLPRPGESASPFDEILNGIRPIERTTPAVLVGAGSRCGTCRWLNTRTFARECGGRCSDPSRV
jgi:hypothetical protein